MAKIVVGVDPDSDENGIAIYKDGELIALHKWNTVHICQYIDEIIGTCDILFSIENVMANNFVYARNTNGNKNIQSLIAMKIGRCQNAQKEIMQWLDRYGIPYVLHKPQSGNWADKKDVFERVTGWEKQSNVDTRAAAYFGYLAVRS